MEASPRIVFDDDNESSHHVRPPPQESAHWQSLDHCPGDRLLESMEQLMDYCRTEVVSFPKHNNSQDVKVVIWWSCLCGYCEALTTHKTNRYQIFPIPIDALRRLATAELHRLMTQLTTQLKTPTDTTEPDAVHRSLVQTTATIIWKNAISKANVRDEWHANSWYVYLRGGIDTKSLDCFGASLVTITAVQHYYRQHHHGTHTNNNNTVKRYQSYLALSEDHAYEVHRPEKEEDDVITRPPTIDTNTNTSWGTCEVAIPGHTKAVQSQRGHDITTTFVKRKSQLTPQTSWLYMANHPVLCFTAGMMLVAVTGNINGTIEKRPRGGSLVSGSLYEFKRNLLWLLYDQGFMDYFPFGLMEMGDCEEHRTSPRGEEWLSMERPKVVLDSQPQTKCLAIEKLFLDAIQISKQYYKDGQSYPYFYAGHFHKDAGNEGIEYEFRLVEAMYFYAQAARVASHYRYEPKDGVQLNKHISAAAMLIAEDILTPKSSPSSDPQAAREWDREQNAIAVASWLLAFFDALFRWEESSNNENFVEILSPSHKFFIAKLFQLVPHPTRVAAIHGLFPTNQNPSERESSIYNVQYFVHPRSRRMSKDSLLLQALQKPKVKVGEIELANLEAGRRKRRRN